MEACSRELLPINPLGGQRRPMRFALAAVLVALLIGHGRAEDLSKISELKDRAAMHDKGRIQYPLEAKRRFLTGSGVAVLKVNKSTGKVTAVRMGKSTGHAILDNATVEGLRLARFRPGSTSDEVQIPVTFTMSGGRFYETVDVKRKDMDEVLSAFLGKGTVVKGPIPQYPRSQPWTHKDGKGVYELHVDKEGKVSRVRIMKSSGDAVFDREAVKTLGKWRLRKGPFVLELPLRFTLTPINYSVDVGR